MQYSSNLTHKLFSGLFWVLLLNLLVKPVWILGIEVGVQNAVGAEAYGLYFTLFNLAYIFNILLDLGITNFNTRNIARHPQLMGKHLSGILTIKLLLLFFYALVTLTVGLLLGYTSRQFLLLAVLCLNQFLNSLILYLRSNFEGLLLFRWDSVLSVIDRVLMIAICSGLLYISHHADTTFRIEWFIYAQTAAYAITAFTALIVLLRRASLRRLHWNRAFALLIIKRSAPFALLVLLMASYNRIDPILLSHLSPTGDTAAGIYASAFRLLDALTMIAYLVSVPLLPVFARLTHSRDTSHGELSTVTHTTFSLLMVFATTAAITLSATAQPLMQLLYNSHIAESAEVFQVLIYGIIPLSFTYIFGTLLTAGGHLRQLNIMALSTLAVNIIVNLILIPRYSATGSAWASLIAQSFMAAAQTLLALHLYRIMPTAAYIARLVAFIAIVVATNLACQWCETQWLMQSTIAVAAAIVAAFVLRLIDIRQLRGLLTKR
ncbi:MAG: oligosaccharide flippase family protein [Bacteroidales bacterium]|nr:oligosaccharide flippase family protein [Bacteroidales bacterium]